jgi:NodT family efflux transporter outer membrane factor (OMF) lipoprotein
MRYGERYEEVIQQASLKSVFLLVFSLDSCLRGNTYSLDFWQGVCHPKDTRSSLGRDTVQFLLAITFALLLLTGCMVGPDFESPLPPQTSSYTESPLPEKTVEAKGSGGEAQYFRLGKEIPAQWWEIFHSKPLNELIKKAFKNSPTLQIAQATLQQAEENLRVGVASLYPFVSVQATPERERFTAAIFGAPNVPPSTFNLFFTSVNITYTLDVFGGIRRQIEALGAQLDNQRFQAEATYLTLTSNIVTTAITEASLQAQIKATKQLVDLQEQTLRITQKKFILGGISRLEVLAQETQLAQTQASLPPLENALAKTHHALSVLVGDLPSESHLPIFKLADLTLPVDLPVSLPSDFVRQRPDIRASEALLQAASAQIGVAIANMLPQVTLAGGYGWAADHLENLFKHRTNVWNVLTNILQPIFQGGALIAKREAAVAAFEQAFAQYRQTVLLAFQNVADTLKALEFDAQQLHIQTAAETAAGKTLSLTQAQYLLGAVSYVNLLDAQRQYQQARIGRIQAEASRYADTAALFQALGGGWWNRKPLCPAKEGSQ